MQFGMMLGIALRSQSTATPTPTPTPSTTLDPSNKSTRVDLSNGNLTGTMNAGADAHAFAKSVGTIPAANGNYYFELNYTPQASTEGGIALVRTDYPLDGTDPHDFTPKGMAIFGSGGYFGSGGLAGSVTGLGTAGKSYGDGYFGVYLRRTGGTDLMFIRFPDGTWSNGGDPTGAGAGHDISAATGGAVLSAPFYCKKAGDTATFKFSSFTHAAAIGTVIPVQ